MFTPGYRPSSVRSNDPMSTLTSASLVEQERFTAARYDISAP